MGVYNDNCDLPEFQIPLVPAGEGASGGGYGALYVSVAPVRTTEVGWTPLFVGSPTEPEKTANLSADRALIYVNDGKGDYPPTSMKIRNPGKARIDWIVEWERPPEG